MLSELKIAIIITSHALMGTTGEPTGVWLEELTTPYYHLAETNIKVVLFSVKGGAIPIDPRSLKSKGENETSVEKYLDDEALKQKLQTTKSISELKISDYDAIFFPGGHGTMWDLPTNKTITSLVSEALKKKLIVSAVCHGPAGLITAKDENGKSLLKGRRVAGFTNSEEEAAGLTKSVPFLLETRLKELGAHYEKGPDFKPFAIRDDNLITGQNPASSKLVVEHIVKALKQREKFPITQ